MRTHDLPSQLITARQGVILVIAAALLIIAFAFLAFSVDVGYMSMTKSQLQNAADAAAFAGVYKLSDGAAATRQAAREVAYANYAAASPVVLADSDIELGVFNYTTKEFVLNETSPNAVRVRTHVENKGLFFAPLIGTSNYNMDASAIAMLNPRDIVFVVDLSGSMNDDTEPCWATKTINDKYGPLGYPSVADPLMQQVFTDFGYGNCPGVKEYIGAPLGVSNTDTAFAEMTQDDGPLSMCIDEKYRISETDDEYVRRQKCYSWIIDNQIAVVMPNAKPAPNSQTSYGYWEKYIDYIMDGTSVGNPPPPPPPSTDPPDPDPVDPPPPSEPPPPYEPPPPKPPVGLNAIEGDRLWAEFNRHVGPRSHGLVAGDVSAAVALLQSPAQMQIGVPRRGSFDEIWVPWGMDYDRIEEFNNPNIYSFPTSSSSLPKSYRNYVGYITYVQFMMDFGRDRSPDVDNWDGNAAPNIGTKTPLSVLSADCPKHAEAVAGYTFQFPPREQPMHAVRRSLIASLEVIRSRNAQVGLNAGDKVAIVTFDGLDSDHAPALRQSLTSDYVGAMSACVDLQAVSDVGSTTATEAGLELARQHLKPVDQGGQGRKFAKKVIVLLTDGIPNAWSSTEGEVSTHMTQNPDGNYYATDYIWLNAALMQTALAQTERTSVYAVGMGLGTDYDFMDRVARMGNTAEGGLSVRGSGNPAEYESRLTEIFGEIIRNPGGRLVE